MALYLDRSCVVFALLPSPATGGSRSRAFTLASNMMFWAMFGNAAIDS